MNKILKYIFNGYNPSIIQHEINKTSDIMQTLNKQIKENNKKFYNDTYYERDIRLFIHAYNNIADRYGTNINNQLELTYKYPDLNEYEKLYIQIIEILNKYCTRFKTTPLSTKNTVRLPIFLQLNKELPSNTITKLFHELDQCTNNYPFLIIEYIFRNETDYPYTTLEMYKQLNEHYHQSLFDVKTEYFTETGELNMDKISLLDYIKNHTNLLR